MILTVILQEPPIWLVLPFVSLLLMIATGPVLFPTIWHHYYKHISIGLGLLVGTYYVFALKDTVLPLETLAEYASFISLLTILYISSGGIYFFVDVESKVWVNIAFLFIAAIFTNIIGTTGASVLFIRPFMRINRYRLKPYHIVFFIFLISNVGGSLTPIGDPPLFMGFLKGVPFFWTAEHLWQPWLVAIISLLSVFYVFEKRNTSLDDVDVSKHYTNKILITGKRNFIWLLLGVSTVFLDPNIIEGLPYIDFHGKKLSFIREIIQLSASLLCYLFANKKALQGNKFDFDAIKEVAFLFFGIFLCMMPALQSLEAFAHHQKDSLVLSQALIYWSSGIFSSVLDNAPTYLNVFALILSSANFNMNIYSDVHLFMASSGVDLLRALSVGSVFFGAMTYIGNGPNFMVKAIAEQTGVKMPSFGKYIWSYSLPILLPILVLISLLFFR
ncbi:MAG: citrate transporter [Bacteroidetes bacterium B1(2017)]|nr:MAG: citrate transporter [Bacteroidetes bacterium B1(2017)]